jgi:hypothetical protein
MKKLIGNVAYWQIVLQKSFSRRCKISEGRWRVIGVMIIASSSMTSPMLNPCFVSSSGAIFALVALRWSSPNPRR